MNISTIIFVSVLVFTALITLFVNLIIYYKKNKHDKELFCKDNLKLYEMELSEYLKSNNVPDVESITKICNRLGYQVKECSNLPKSVEAKVDDSKIIYIRKDLSIPEKNFNKAHEIAHIIRGNTGSVNRTKHSIRGRSDEEQICDYLAAALLLPLSEMQKRMNEINYENLTKRQKLRFVSEMAEVKDLREEVVIRRLIEIKKLS